jgi:acetyl-CoA C-acetyltransferase
VVTNGSSSSTPPEDRRPVVIAARRTPVGRAWGTLAGVDAATLLSTVLTDVVAEAAIDPREVDDVIVGNAAGGGGNLARLGALAAGLPVEVPGVTVDRQCGSGLEAIVLAARLVAAGAGQLYLAGGVESVSTAPWRVEPPGRPGVMPRFYARARFAPEAIGDPEMGVAAENVARAFHVSRERQDAFALASHRRAVAAAEAGRFAAEITPVETTGQTVAADECPRRDTSAERLARLRPVFAPDGSVTAGNSCPLNDGAAMVVVTSLARARALGRRHALGFVDAAAAGVDPNVLGIGPVASTRRLLKRRPDLRLEDAGVIEFNEAFAAQVLASLEALGIDPGRVNRDGGALALGHPYGASGAILVVRLFTQLVREPAPESPAAGLGLGLAMIGIAGGLGITAVFERVTT